MVRNSLVTNVQLLAEDTQSITRTRNTALPGASDTVFAFTQLLIFNPQ